MVVHNIARLTLCLSLLFIQTISFAQQKGAAEDEEIIAVIGETSISRIDYLQALITGAKQRLYH